MMEANGERNHILNINIGILGHVDSGKTSLVKALSTSLSTAALDKHPQSQQRGITLDLGFSAFTLPLSGRLESLLRDQCGSLSHRYDTVQFTLVDCPGHASLIRTIIGGAQIIDMIVLVVDANKGIQTQTAECIVLAEITTETMIIALNKVDLLPAAEREDRIVKITKKIKKTLSATKFSNVAIIPVSASIGGEKVAANVAAEERITVKGSYRANTISEGIHALIESIKEHFTVPVRNVHQFFYFAVDHCFPIKGHGTVLTGTVLSGSVHINQVIEIPQLQLQRKVKSLQMFHKPVKYARQGDRVGICVTNLDAKLIERGIAATPGTVPFVTAAICLVKKIRFFRFPCKSKQKFHISIGHETIVATAVFFGGQEVSSLFDQTSNFSESVASAMVKNDFLIEEMPLSENASLQQSEELQNQVCQSTLTASYQKLFPSIDFDWNSDYLYQEEILETEGLTYGKEPIQWVLLQFQQPVYCPSGSLLIGSRLDVDTKDNHHHNSSSTPSVSANASQAHQCRLAFYGPIKEIIPHPTSANGTLNLPTTANFNHQSMNDQLQRLNVFIWKQKECEIFRLTDLRGPMVYEVIGWKLIAGPGTNIHHYIGMKVLTQRGIVGTIVNSYGTEGKFRVKFSHGAKIKVGDKLIFKYKKYLYDKTRRIHQSLLEDMEDRQLLLVQEDLQEAQLSTTAEHSTIVTDEEGIESFGLKQRMQKLLSKQKKKLHQDIQSKMVEVATEKEKDEDKEGKGKGERTSRKNQHSAEKLILEFIDVESLKQLEQIEKVESKQEKGETNQHLSSTITSQPSIIDSVVSNTSAFDVFVPEGVNEEVRLGKIDSIKSESFIDPTGNIAEHAIVSGAFRMEENIRLYLGSKCITEKNDIGELAAPFGKLGKCKITFTSKCNAAPSSTIKIKILKK